MNLVHSIFCTRKDLQRELIVDFKMGKHNFGFVQKLIIKNILIDSVEIQIFYEFL